MVKNNGEHSEEPNEGVFDNGLPATQVMQEEASIVISDMLDSVEDQVKGAPESSKISPS